jgi:hypothetical protein
MRWLRLWWTMRKAKVDGQVLRPAFEKVVRTNHPHYNDTEVALIVDEMMQMHNDLEDGVIR